MGDLPWSVVVVEEAEGLLLRSSTSSVLGGGLEGLPLDSLSLLLRGAMTEALFVLLIGEELEREEEVVEDAEEVPDFVKVGLLKLEEVGLAVPGLSVPSSPSSD